MTDLASSGSVGPSSANSAGSSQASPSTPAADSGFTKMYRETSEGLLLAQRNFKKQRYLGCVSLAAIFLMVAVLTIAGTLGASGTMLFLRRSENDVGVIDARFSSPLVDEAGERASLNYTKVKERLSHMDGIELLAVKQYAAETELRKGAKPISQTIKLIQDVELEANECLVWEGVTDQVTLGSKINMSAHINLKQIDEELSTEFLELQCKVKNTYSV